MKFQNELIIFLISGYLGVFLCPVLTLFYIHYNAESNFQIMKASKGKANPGILNKILLEKLNAKS